MLTISGNGQETTAPRLIQEFVLSTTNIPKREIAMVEPQPAPNKRCAKNVTQNTEKPWDTIIKTAYAHVAEPNVQAKVLNIL